VYLPRHFAVDDLERVAAFVDDVGAADLVTFDGTRPVASLLPVLWDRADGEYGRLLGHLALANRQWSTAAPGTMALAVVHGPQAYISPSWYASKQEHGRVVPTWNYASVHFTGPVTFHRDPQWLRDIVTRLTDRHERDRDQRWAVSDAPQAFIEGQLRGIVGFEMSVVSVEAKEKLGQNRSEGDRAGAIAGLRADPHQDALAVAGLMEELRHDPDR
jgi:transcriptional regulator